MARSPTDDDSPASRIAVYGATGYTGRLVAAELARRGADFVLAGRSASKLEIVAEDVGGAPTTAVELADAAGLRALLEPCAAVISCAGPFVDHGEPVVRAAIEASTDYLDTTGEQPFMRRVFDDHGPRAEAAGVALVPAFGFDYVPGDMIAALTADGIGPLSELVLAYCPRGFGPSRGTARSAIGMLAGGDVEWRDGALRPAPQGVSRGRFEFPAPIGSQRMIRYPAGEHLTVPRHVETKRVRTLLAASAVAPERLTVLAGLAGPLQLLLRTPARRALEVAVARLPEGPSVARRRRATFTIVCEARGAAGSRRGVVSGSDVYGLTAVIAVEGALRLAAGTGPSGALAPSQAFEPGGFLDSLDRAGVAWEVERG